MTFSANILASVAAGSSRASLMPIVGLSLHHSKPVAEMANFYDSCYYYF